MFKRYDAKRGKVPPADFSPAQDPDPITGHWPGWIPIGIGPEDRWHREAFERQDYTFNGEPLIGDIPDGTYELVGPKIGGNKESWPRHALIKHGGEVYDDCPRTFDELKSYLANMNIEGIVWHHPDGRMVKIKRRNLATLRVVSLEHLAASDQNACAVPLPSGDTLTGNCPLI